MFFRYGINSIWANHAVSAGRLAPGQHTGSASTQETHWLCDFLLSTLDLDADKNLMFTSVDPEEAEAGGGGSSATCAPIVTRETMVAFDFASLITFRHYRKVAIFAPAEVEKLISTLPVTSVQTLALLQEGLRNCDRIVAFDARHVIELLLLGGRDVRLARLPAQRPTGRSTFAPDLVIIQHGTDEWVLQSLMKTIERAHPRKKISIYRVDDPAQESFAVSDTQVHIHVGRARRSFTTMRVVDSFAARCAVIQLDAAASARQLDDADVEHLKSGLVVATPADAAWGLTTRLGDAATVAAFRRFSGRIVDDFNQEAKRQLLEALS